MNKKRANLRDVAIKAGVSVATVSRVMNSPKQVSEETRKRVEEAITELRFSPSAAARAINSGRTRTVAALLPTLENSTFARFTEGLETRLGEFDLSLIVATTRDDPEIELAKARQLVDIGAEAIVVSGISQSPLFQQYVDRINLPAVGISLFEKDAWLPTIGYDNHKAVNEALRHLTHLGHREIAVVHGPRSTSDRTRARLDALQTARAQAADPLSFHFIEAPLSLQGGSEAATVLLNLQQNAITAVLAFTDILAMGVMNMLHQRGKRVPTDYSVIGMEDLPASAYAFPPLTTVHLPVRRMGEKTAEALHQWLNQGERPAPLDLPFELKLRASTTAIG